MKKLIVLGYGNPDRGDDGVAYYLLEKLITFFSQYEKDLVDFHETGFATLNPNIDLWYNLQLIPEISQELANYRNAIFLDAHTAEIPENILVQEIKPAYKSSPFTHHLTPASCLELAQKLYQHAPDTILVSVRGYSFDFSQELSPQTQLLTEQAFNLLVDLIQKGTKQ